MEVETITLVVILTFFIWFVYRDYIKERALIEVGRRLDRTHQQFLDRLREIRGAIGSENLADARAAERQRMSASGAASCLSPYERAKAFEPTQPWHLRHSGADEERHWRYSVRSFGPVWFVATAKQISYEIINSETGEVRAVVEKVEDEKWYRWDSLPPFSFELG